MKGYVSAALERLYFKQSKQLHAPSMHIMQYGQDAQKPIPPPPNMRQISDSEEKFIKYVVGTFLHYGRAVIPTALHALNFIASSKTLD